MATLPSRRFVRIEWSSKLENWVAIYDGRIRDESPDLFALVQQWDGMMDLETSDLASTLLGYLDEWDGRAMEN